MIRDDCDCDDNLASNGNLTHIKCKIIRLVDDQVKKSDRYISRIAEDDPCKSRGTVSLNKLCLYGLGIILAVGLILALGVFLGAAICAKNNPPGKNGVF